MDEDRRFALESRLTNNGCYLQSITVEGDTYAMTYQSVAADQHGEVPHQQVGDIVNVFRELFDHEDWPVRGVDATVTDLDDDQMGTWHAEAAWFEALEAGDMTEVEFSRRLVATLEQA
jgi:hypothetical protein